MSILKFSLANLVFVSLLWQLWLPLLFAIFSEDKKSRYVRYLFIALAVSFVVNVPGIWALTVFHVACANDIQTCPSLVLGAVRFVEVDEIVAPVVAFVITAAICGYDLVSKRSHSRNT
jgi:hypothetical protein